MKKEEYEATKTKLNEQIAHEDWRIDGLRLCIKTAKHQISGFEEGWEEDFETCMKVFKKHGIYKSSRRIEELQLKIRGCKKLKAAAQENLAILEQRKKLALSSQGAGRPKTF